MVYSGISVFLLRFEVLLGLVVLGRALEAGEGRVQAVEGALPEALVALHVLGRLLEGRSLEVAVAGGADPAAGDQSGALQHLQVLGDRRLAHREGLRQLGNARVAALEALEERTAGRVGERG